MINQTIPHKTTLQIEEVKKKVCNRLGVTYGLMHSKSQEPNIVIARHYVFKYVKEFTKLSLAMIGKHTFLKDHATVLWGLKKIKYYEETEQDTRDNIAYFDKCIKPIFKPDYIFVGDVNKALKSYQNRARLFHSVKN